MPKMPKIVESLRSVFSMNDRCLAYGKPEIREIIPDLAFLFKIENLVLWARSEMIGYAIDQISEGFQVSGFRCQEITNPEH
jgi:hypothetical protein